MAKEIPLALPTNRIMIDTIIWSLRFRFFAWQNSSKLNVKPDIKLYLLYHNPNSNAILSHSTALNKGIIGFVKLYADAKYADKNIMILAHELLHTLTATDKYNLDNTLATFRNGFVESENQPLYPQDLAE